jgi:histidine triad (HIT) family protein
MAGQSCIFCRIALGEIPSQVVFKDERVVAFMDINPVSRGHAIVIPTEHACFLWQLSAPSLSALGVALGRISLAVKQGVGAEALNILQNNGRLAGQEVEHVHFHLIPRFPADHFHYRWPSTPADKAQLAEICGLIVKHLGC